MAAKDDYRKYLSHGPFSCFWQVAEELNVKPYLSLTRQLESKLVIFLYIEQEISVCPSHISRTVCLIYFRRVDNCWGSEEVQYPCVKLFGWAIQTASLLLQPTCLVSLLYLTSLQKSATIWSFFYSEYFSWTDTAVCCTDIALFTFYWLTHHRTGEM